ncbi:MAG: Transcriptional regulator PA2737, MerR family, partial [uncultured Acetobacteraceae bacterium]
ERDRRAVAVTRPQGAERLPHHQRGGGRPAHPAARPAVLGNQVPAAQAAEARRRPALLPAGRHIPAAPGERPALHAGLHHQGRAAAPAGRRAGRGHRRRRPRCPRAAGNRRFRPPRDPGRTGRHLGQPARPAGGL